MFCINENQLYISEENAEYSHADWFKMMNWSEDIINWIIRGQVDIETGNIDFYVGKSYDVDDNIEEEFFLHLKELVSKLNIAPSSKIFGGKIKRSSPGLWPSRREYGEVAKFIS